MRARGLIVAVACAAAADVRAEGEVGARLWLSTGETQWNHTAPGLGSPTSVLSYEDLRGLSAEIFFRKAFAQHWFVRGDAGFGRLGDGSLRDEDYAAGQVKFSDTTSAVGGGSLRHVTLDVGRTVLQPAGSNWNARVFAGLQYWAERQDARGLANSPGFAFSPTLGQNVPVISNEMRWTSLRVGGGATFARAPWTVSVDLALVPHTNLHNRDFHYLRPDLGGVPNIYMNGKGTGWQLDAEVRRELARNLSFGVGVRYWKLDASGTVHFGGAGPFPLNSLESRRGGVTASLLLRQR